MFHRVAMVTGASRGIGREIALTLCRSNSDIIVASPEIENNESVAEAIRQCGGSAMTLNLDVTSEESVKNGIAAALGEMRRIDVLVNNAGITRDGLAMRMKPADWDLVLKVNLTGAFQVTQAVIPAMEGALGSHHQHRFGGGRDGQSGAVELCGVEGGADRADEVPGARTGEPEHHREPHRAGLH